MDWYENLDNAELKLDKDQLDYFIGRFNAVRYVENILNNYPKK